MNLKMRHLSLLLVDLAAVAIATVGALVMRENANSSIESLTALLPYLTISLVASAVLFPIFGLNRTIWRFSTFNDQLKVVIAVICVVLTSISVGFAINRLEGVARTLPLIQTLFAVFLMASIRFAMRERELLRKPAQRRLLRKDQESRRTVALVVGLDDLTEMFLGYIHAHHADQVLIAGVLGRSDRQTGRLAHQSRVLGKPEDISRIMADLDAGGGVEVVG